MSSNQWTVALIEQFGEFDISWHQPIRQLTDDEVIAKGLDPAYAEHVADGPVEYSIGDERVDAETWHLVSDALEGWFDYQDTLTAV